MFYKSVMNTAISIVAYLVVASACLGAEPLANEGKRGLYVRSIEQVLRTEPDEIDIGTAALIVSEQWSNIVAGRRYQARLDEMALEIRSRLKEKKIGINPNAIAEINNYLFDELKFSAANVADDPEDLFLHSVMDRRRGYCLSLSILYLAIGERLGLPLYGVVVPGHFFVRYDNGKVRFNIEATAKGASPTDQYYIEKFNVPQDTAHGIYMTNLNKLQSLGCLFNNFGNVYRDIGDVNQAMEALELAVWINPWLGESRTNLGNIYLAKERVDDAIAQYQGALKINSDDAKSQCNLGSAFLKKGWLNDAVCQYSQGIRLDPNLPDAHRGLAIAYSEQKQHGQAKSTLMHAITLWPNDASLYCTLGDVFSRAGQYDEAIPQYQRALKLKGDMAQAYYGLGICYGKLTQTDDEIEAYKKAVSLKPDLVDALANIGDAYFRQGKYDASITYYRKVIETRPNEGIIYYNIGSAFMNKEDYNQAATAYSKAIELEPNMGDAHCRLGYAYYQLKKYDLALQHVKKAQDLGTEVDKQILKAIQSKVK